MSRCTAKKPTCTPAVQKPRWRRGFHIRIGVAANLLSSPDGADLKVGSYAMWKPRHLTCASDRRRWPALHQRMRAGRANTRPALAWRAARQAAADYFLWEAA